MKKTAQTEAELTKNKDDKHPLRRKQQKTVSDETFKEKNLKTKIQLAQAQAEALALKHAMRRRIGQK